MTLDGMMYMGGLNYTCIAAVSHNTTLSTMGPACIMVLRNFVASGLVMACINNNEANKKLACTPY